MTKIELLGRSISKDLAYAAWVLRYKTTESTSGYDNGLYNGVLGIVRHYNIVYSGSYYIDVPDISEITDHDRKLEIVLYKETSQGCYRVLHSYHID